MENDTSPDLARGLLFAFGSIIFYGSFAVPIKSKRVIDAKVSQIPSKTTKPFLQTPIPPHLCPLPPPLPGRSTIIPTLQIHSILHIQPPPPILQPLVLDMVGFPRQRYLGCYRHRRYICRPICRSY